MTEPPTVVWTIVVAAGTASRFGADKLSVALAGDATVLEMSVAGANRNSSGIVVVLHPADPMLGAQPQQGMVFVAGGESRSASVRNGLAVVPQEVQVILIHDGARPLADDALYGRVIEAVVDGAHAVVPVVRVIDTIRRLNGEPVDRDELRAVQTPQGFGADTLRSAHVSRADATDDAALVEALGHTVVLVAGDTRNLKITRPSDIEMARALLQSQPDETGE